jgi:hypothetical protein
LKTRLFILMVGLLSLTIFMSCDEDTPTIPPPPKIPPDVWLTLEEKDEVFKYLEKVYEKKAFNRYDLLLDENFSFRFGDDDYSSGNTDRDWGRLQELNSVSKMLGGWPHPQYGAVVQVDIVIFPQGQIWTEIPKNDPPFTGETWYQKSFNYRMEITTNNGTSLRAYDIAAFFIVRQSEVDGKNIWRIVQWNDDIGLRSMARDPQPSEDTSWGRIKTLYN